LTRFFQTVEWNPFWESYVPSGNEEPLPRTGHVSVTTGGCIIVFVSLLPSPSPLIAMFCRFGGSYSTRHLNDTWSFNISRRKWTKLQCTGSIPTPRAGHAAVLLGDVMYVFGGFGGHPIGGTYLGGTYLGDLTALNLSSK